MPRIKVIHPLTKRPVEVAYPADISKAERDAKIRRVLAQSVVEGSSGMGELKYRDEQQARRMAAQARAAQIARAKEQPSGNVTIAPAPRTPIRREPPKRPVADWYPGVYSPVGSTIDLEPSVGHERPEKARKTDNRKFRPDEAATPANIERYTQKYLSGNRTRSAPARKAKEIIWRTPEKADEMMEGYTPAGKAAIKKWAAENKNILEWDTIPKPIRTTIRWVRELADDPVLYHPDRTKPKSVKGFIVNAAGSTPNPALAWAFQRYTQAKAAVNILNAREEFLYSLKTGKDEDRKRSEEMAKKALKDGFDDVVPFGHTLRTTVTKGPGAGLRELGEDFYYNPVGVGYGLFEQGAKGYRAYKGPKANVLTPEQWMRKQASELVTKLKPKPKPSVVPVPKPQPSGRRPQPRHQLPRNVKEEQRRLRAQRNGRRNTERERRQRR